MVLLAGAWAGWRKRVSSLSRITSRTARPWLTGALPTAAAGHSLGAVLSPGATTGDTVPRAGMGTVMGKGLRTGLRRTLPGVIREDTVDCVRLKESDPFRRLAVLAMRGLCS